MHTYLPMYTYIYIYYINIVNIKKFKAFCTCLRVVKDLFYPWESTNMCMALLCLSVELDCYQNSRQRVLCIKLYFLQYQKTVWASSFLVSTCHWILVIPVGSVNLLLKYFSDLWETERKSFICSISFLSYSLPSWFEMR